MAGFEEYSFKPTGRSREQTWAIRDGRLMRRGGERTVLLDQITRATYGSFAYRGTRSTWLHLDSGDGILKLSCNDSGEGEDHDRFIELVVALLNRMNPDAGIRVDSGTGFKRAMFFVCLAGAGAGASFMFAGLTGSVGPNAGLAIGLGFIMLAVSGGFSWQFSPWRQPAALTPAELAERLRSETFQG